ncbi:beta-phosphoglucomutase [Alkalicoccus luteus]|uniref:Beta-phosphoglucomutase n=1 Tax=Alkalicoccus luteus TaxID=1237094 RepID=A0A969PXP3_9BACI|nr:beta-phosphoglucomutase [Alkalicoccus luteus]NJP39349.1 beta-phosphoglucomutase [Alkalicoccus luteus]
MKQIEAVIFDLDGVLIDTAEYHYVAWKNLAADMGFEFKREDNERLKGVSREESLRILLETGAVEKTEAEKQELAARKNEAYLKSIQGLTEEDLLPGVRGFLRELQTFNVPFALGSASRNASVILEGTGISPLFAAVVDGNDLGKAKPDPEVFLKGAEKMGIAPEACVVFEDAQAGIDAARAAGMRVVAVGSPEMLTGADFYISNLKDITFAGLKRELGVPSS